MTGGSDQGIRISFKEDGGVEMCVWKIVKK